MKKCIMRVIATALLIVLCLTQTFVVALTSEEYQTVESCETVTIDGETYIVAESHSVYAATACTHEYTTIIVTGECGETCNYIIYGFVKICNLCNCEIEGGTLLFPKETPTHSFDVFLVPASETYHTYERRCTVPGCGFVAEAWTEAHDLYTTMECDGIFDRYTTSCRVCGFASLDKKPCKGHEIALICIDTPEHDSGEQ